MDSPGPWAAVPWRRINPISQNSGWPGHAMALKILGLHPPVNQGIPPEGHHHILDLHPKNDSTFHPIIRNPKLFLIALIHIADWMFLIFTRRSVEIGYFRELRHAWAGNEKLYVLLRESDWGEAHSAEPNLGYHCDYLAEYGLHVDQLIKYWRGISWAIHWLQKYLL